MSLADGPPKFLFGMMWSPFFKFIICGPPGIIPDIAPLLIPSGPASLTRASPPGAPPGGVPFAKAPVKAPAKSEIAKKKEVPQLMVKEEAQDFPELNTPMPEASLRDQYRGKFTIQLGSYQSLRDAESFADGFRIRGYKPIINEVDIKKRGIWYRVSLGIFESAGKAKDYVLREKVLFKGQDYVIGKFD